ncbi:MAG: M20 family metallopeptidase [Planctomyces sp.]|jgi:amidohydrolase
MNRIDHSRITAADIERVIPFEVLIDRIAESRASALTECRRALHQFPEPSGEETATTAFIADRLKQLGIDARIPDRGVGVIGDLRIGPKDDTTPIIALRADIDALRMTDAKNVEYASQRSGFAHACGHDAHTTVILAAAEILETVASRSQESELPPMRFRFIFQPAEETAQGAEWMISDGALDGVQEILGLHMDPTIRAGRVGIRYGVLTAQVDDIHFLIHGRGGHAARPHDSSDPIAAAVLLVSTFYQQIPRNADALTPTVFTIGSIHGGTASNVIPDHVRLSGTLRSTDSTTRAATVGKIRKICESVGAMTGNTIEPEFRMGLGAVINDYRVTSALEESARLVIGSDNVVSIGRPSMGGEDFAAYIERIPGAQFRLGCAGDDRDWPLLHSPVFDIEESSMVVGARVLARAALLLAMTPRRITT